MDRKVLGRGLDSLISSDAAPKERIQTIGVERVRASRFQPRLTFNDDRIEELANSIREKGVIQPILVRAAGNDYFELIAGERRWRAAQKAGLTEIPAIVRRVADEDLLELSIIENVQREELNAIEEAKAYQRLAMEFGLTQDSIAQKVGKDKSSISNLLRILNLPQEVQECLSKNLITFGHAKALLTLGDPARQEAVCREIVEKGLSVRQIEQVASPEARSRRTPKLVAKDRDVQDVEQRLARRLGTRVRIKHGKKRGKIVIEYLSLDDLDRVLRLVGA